jgi:hypothetical protein
LNSPKNIPQGSILVLIEWIEVESKSTGEEGGVLSDDRDRGSQVLQFERIDVDAVDFDAS